MRLGLAIFEMIKTSEPEMAHGDFDSIGRVARDLAITLGGVLSTVSTHHGEEAAKELLAAFNTEAVRYQATILAQRDRLLDPKPPN